MSAQLRGIADGDAISWLIPNVQMPRGRILGYTAGGFGVMICDGMIRI
jgi:hypothetical protein